jgi:hypothetical protein
LEEEQQKFILDLLCKGHPNHEEKVGKGVAYVKTGQHSEYTDTKCFLIVRVDGSEVDFSYYKCCGRIFPVQGNMGRGRGRGGYGNRGRGGREPSNG